MFSVLPATASRANCKAPLKSSLVIRIPAISNLATGLDGNIFRQLSNHPKASW